VSSTVAGSTGRARTTPLRAAASPQSRPTRNLASRVGEEGGSGGASGGGAAARGGGESSASHETPRLNLKKKPDIRNFMLIRVRMYYLMKIVFF
tara:strand:+ start:1808 stop:2089 length:282 start_codon:yes stop_codon:yes gene_type:complete